MRLPGVLAFLFAVAACGTLHAAGTPRELTTKVAVRHETGIRLSDRTLVLGIQVDRDGAQLVTYTIKDRPFFGSSGEPPAPRPYDPLGELQLELRLTGSDGNEYLKRVTAGPLCFDHRPETEPHIEGDTIRRHRDGFVVEVPEIAGHDRFEIAYHERYRGEISRLSLGTDTIDRARFTSAAGELRYDDLKIATSSPEPRAVSRGSTPLWPEDFGDTDIHAIYGDPAEGDRRLNIVIVPDGYTYAQKALMEQHAEELINHVRGLTPTDEHDSLINYTLVYAYSVQSGTDECDCGTTVDTPMGSNFPVGDGICGSSANRCLSYGPGCDNFVLANLLEAEMRAPFHDETLVMVNTTRYGGCAGFRATYSAGNSSGEAVAIHEMGHSVAGLSDEYGGNSSCGPAGNTPNTSSNPLLGNWPEWIDDIGAPHEGARYYDQCIYRPESLCKMRTLDPDFCAVCTQQWALTFFGASRVAPSAPIDTVSANPSQVVVGAGLEFSITTRFAQGAGVTNAINWTVDGPGLAGPTPVGSGTPLLQYSFSQVGEYTVTAEAIADTNFIKPEKYGLNRDVVQWSVESVPTICEVGCADGLPECDADNDGLGDNCDPCASDALNACFGPVSLDNTALRNIRINTDGSSSDACSGDKTDCRGKSWVADFGAPGALTGYNQAGDPHTCDLPAGCPIDESTLFGCTSPATADLLRCAHRDPTGSPELSYHFDVPDGDYLLNLLLMNADATTTGPGDRIFSVALNGDVPVQLADLDPVVAAGGPCDPGSAPCLPVSRAAVVAVSGGNGLEIEFLSGVERPMIQGIELLCAERTWYDDADQDGYGNPGAPIVACYRPAGYLADDSDCDDSSSLSNPAAPEICDGLDNDCDLEIDDDGDGDGYGICDDCAEGVSWAWSPPGEVTGVLFTDKEFFRWNNPVPAGSQRPLYNVLRSNRADDFGNAVCTGNLYFVNSFGPTEAPQVHRGHYYLVVGEGVCGAGSAGTGSDGLERLVETCNSQGNGQ